VQHLYVHFANIKVILPRNRPAKSLSAPVKI
jgi:hypothetical protein